MKVARRVWEEAVGKGLPSGSTSLAAYFIHNLGEALEKVLARHHGELKRAFMRETEQQSLPLAEREVHVASKPPSQAEQVRIARQERRRTIFTQVHELYAQGWSCASIARMLGIHRQDRRQICYN